MVIKMKRILIVRPDGIGDFIIFSAVLEEYVKLYPGYSIDLLCHPYVEELAQSIPFIDRIFCIDRDKIFRKRYLVYTLMSLIKLMQYKYDRVIYPVYSRTMQYDLLAKFVRAKEKIVFDGDDSNDFKNKRFARNKYFTQIIEGEKPDKIEIERNVEFINKLGINANVDITTAKPRIWFSAKDDIEFQRLREKFNLRKNEYILIFPGAGHHVRYWENKKWVQLIRQILGKNARYKIVILGYGNDIFPIKAVLNALDSSCKERIVNLYKKTTLRILAKVIKNAKLFIGTESGAVHIAVAVDTPNICLMGGGHFGRFYPYGDLKKNRIIYKKLDCFGCGWKCRYKAPKCIKEIKVNDVWKEVTKFLS